MSRFSFANLTGPRRKAKAEEDAPEEDEETPDEAGSEEEETEAEGEGEEEDEEETSPEAHAAHRRGLAEGRRRERARCAAILAAASSETVAMAANLAFNSSVSAREAEGILASAPQGGGLGARMKGRDPAPIASGGGGANASGLPAELQAAQAQILATRKKER